MGDGARIFETKHMASLMLYLLEHGDSATRMMIYDDIANNDHMPDKFAVLDTGLIVQTRDRFSRAVTLTLSDKGREAAEALLRLVSIIRRGQEP